MTAWFDVEDFSGLVGDPFEVALPDGGALTLVLREASTTGVPGGTGPDGTPRDQFSLVFTGPRRRP
nr:hypothetical protein [Nocardioides humi]